MKTSTWTASFRHPSVRRTVTLKVKCAEFQQITRSRTARALFGEQAGIIHLVDALLEPLFSVGTGIRLLGVT